jgi:dihydroxy-acid dehydratase
MRHPRMAAASKRVVETLWGDLKPDRILTHKGFGNALVVQAPVAGSTNAIIRLIAMSGRAGVSLTPDDFDAFPRTMPCIANQRPLKAVLMKGFFCAGGLLALLKQLDSRLHKPSSLVQRAWTPHQSAVSLRPAW